MKLTLRGLLILAAAAAVIVLAILVLAGHHSATQTKDLLAWGLIAGAVGLLAAVVPDR
jgi:hypothetical protein